MKSFRPRIPESLVFPTEARPIADLVKPSARPEFRHGWQIKKKISVCVIFVNSTRSLLMKNCDLFLLLATLKAHRCSTSASACLDILNHFQQCVYSVRIRCNSYQHLSHNSQLLHTPLIPFLATYPGRLRVSRVGSLGHTNNYQSPLIPKSINLD